MISRVLLVAGCLALPARAQLEVSLLGTPIAGRPIELRITGLPSVANPFDPEQIAVNGTFAGPKGAEILLPAFWYQDFSRTLAGGREQLAPAGPGEWRLRFTGVEAGSYRVAVGYTLAGIAQAESVEFGFVLGVNTNAQDFVRLAGNRSFFVRGNEEPLVLVGHCACWHHAGGTADYERWLTAMGAVGENYTRLWMWPHAFGIEIPGVPLTTYRMDRAWQLDRVMEMASERGIRAMLCFDYHGMFESEPDYWGGNNYWPVNPYNQSVGGPCASANEFFTRAEAKVAYQKRLRYLVARYSAYPSLLAWQFFNEIDNVYRYLQANDVAAWHAEMGDWLSARDPYRHPVTTSFGGGSERPEIWDLPQMDFVMYHSYNQPDLALGLGDRVRQLRARYGKPVMVGEFGVNWQGWNRAANDPYLRGFRQGIWTGLMAGSVGTSMSWWWENIHEENLYPQFRVVRDLLARVVAWDAEWQSMDFRRSGPLPERVGELEPGGGAFNVRLNLNGQWGHKPRGTMAVADPEGAMEAAGLLNAFIHGTSHADLRTPFRLSLWSTASAKLTLHLNSVSAGAIAEVWIDGARILRQSLPNLDGGYQVNNEYNSNLVVALPEGKHQIDIRNAGADWFYLDWVGIEGVRSAGYDGGWKPEPVAVGIRSGNEAVIYVAHSKLKYPAQQSDASWEPTLGLELVCSNWPGSGFSAEWWDAASGESRGRTRGSDRGGLWTLELPKLGEDLVGYVVREPRIGIAPQPAGKVTLRVEDAVGGEWLPLRSTELSEPWSTGLSYTNGAVAEFPANAPKEYFRARLLP